MSCGRGSGRVELLTGACSTLPPDGMVLSNWFVLILGIVTNGDEVDETGLISSPSAVEFRGSTEGRPASDRRSPASTREPAGLWNWEKLRVTCMLPVFSFLLPFWDQSSTVCSQDPPGTKTGPSRRMFPLPRWASFRGQKFLAITLKDSSSPISNALGSSLQFHTALRSFVAVAVGAVPMEVLCWLRLSMRPTSTYESIL